MKLWMVIYLAGKVGGTVGPLPYDLDECERRVAESNADGNPEIVTPNGYTTKDVRFACEFHEQRPANDPTAGEPKL